MALTSQQLDRSASLDEARFVALWNRCAFPSAVSGAQQVFGALLSRYQEPHRRYHSPEHIQHCLRQFDFAVAHIPTPDAVEMALWFHDAVYDIDATDNELKSASLFADFAQDCMPKVFIRLVEQLIMVTVHPSYPQSLDEQFVVDIDLSSFALPWDKFCLDSMAVRAEKPQVSDQVFYTGQAKFLSNLLARNSFFFTSWFQINSEQAARDNLKRYLADSAQTYSQ